MEMTRTQLRVRSARTRQVSRQASWKTSAVAASLFLIPFVLILFASHRADAVINVTEVGRASRVETTTASTGAVSSITVYGGIAGDANRCPDGSGGSTSQTCNNCQLVAGETVPNGSPDTLLKPCNATRINPSLQLAFTFSSDAIAGTSAITNSNGDAALTPNSGNVAVTKGQATTIYIPWSAICTKIFSDSGDGGDGSTCIPVSGKASGTIRIGLTSGTSGVGLLNGASDDVRVINITIRTIPNSSALAEKCSSAGANWQVCYFEMGPGDEKAIVKTVLGPSGQTFPATDYKFVRFLYAEKGFNYITMASAAKDLPIEATDTSSFSISPRRIEGLTNDNIYYFKSALIDTAGNVGFYSQSANDTDCSNSATGGNDCRKVQPSEVVGVLDKTNCFIATAAYGTQFAPQLDILRDFRDQILMNSQAGRDFIHFYYAKSPYYAKLILQSTAARATVRAALIPVVWFAGMTLAYGPLKASLAFLASLILVAAFIQMGRRRFAHDKRVHFERCSGQSASTSGNENFGDTATLESRAKNAANTLRSGSSKDRTRESLLPLILAALTIPALTAGIFGSSSFAAPSRAHAAQWGASSRLNAAQTTAKAPRSKRTPAQNNSSIEPLEAAPAEVEDAPPEPEYPYPGAQGTVPIDNPFPEQRLGHSMKSKPAKPEPRKAQVGSTYQATPAPSEDILREADDDAPSPIERAQRKFGGDEKPRAITEDGEYIYEKIPDTPPKKYDKPTPYKFSNAPGREKPASITADGQFNYPVAESPFTAAAGFRIGFMAPPAIKNSTNGLTFKQIYGDADVPGILFEYEYPLTRAIGRIGLKFETGGYVTQAQGRFLRAARANEIPEEKFTFFMIPLQAMIHYRFQFADAQYLVPFVEGGASYNGIVELRDDNKRPRFGGAPTLVAGGGLNILLDWLDKQSVRQLDAEYGINHVWLTMQYRQVVGLKSDLDFTGHIISAGFTVDY